MSELGWCVVLMVLLIAFLGSEMSLYDDLKAWLRLFEEDEKRKTMKGKDQ